MWLKGYDAWKTASPDDEPGRTCGCDVCGASTTGHLIQQCWSVTGIETFACPACRGGDPAGYDEDWTTT
jgi:hypothetical protein